VKYRVKLLVLEPHFQGLSRTGPTIDGKVPTYLVESFHHQARILMHWLDPSLRLFYRRFIDCNFRQQALLPGLYQIQSNFLSAGWFIDVPRDSQILHYFIDNHVASYDNWKHSAWFKWGFRLCNRNYRRCSWMVWILESTADDSCRGEFVRSFHFMLPMVKDNPVWCIQWKLITPAMGKLGWFLQNRFRVAKYRELATPTSILRL